MSESTKDIMDSLFANRLKSVDTYQLQDIIAKAIGEIVGRTYTCDITSIHYTNPTRNNGADITIKLREIDEEVDSIFSISKE